MMSFTLETVSTKLKSYNCRNQWLAATKTEARSVEAISWLLTGCESISPRLISISSSKCKGNRLTSFSRFKLPCHKSLFYTLIFYQKARRDFITGLQRPLHMVPRNHGILLRFPRGRVFFFFFFKTPRFT